MHTCGWKQHVGVCTLGMGEVLHSLQTIFLGEFVNTPGMRGEDTGGSLTILTKITIDNVEAIFPILSLGTPGSQVQTTSENIVKILYVFNNFGL